MGDRRTLRATGIRAGLAPAPPETDPSETIAATPLGEPAIGEVLAPIEADQEVWASGVTYQRSREAREAESTVSDVYARVYDAARPELFFKSNGWRVAGHQMPIRVRADSAWNVPEPELTLVVNAAAEIVGLHDRQRRVLPRHRRGKPALPPAGQGLQRLVRPRSGDSAHRAPTA